MADQLVGGNRYHLLYVLRHHEQTLEYPAGLLGSSQADRVLLSEQADLLEDFRGAGDLAPIDPSWPTL